MKRSVFRLWFILFLLAGTSPGLQDDERTVTGAEPEEAPELIPQNPIPWDESQLLLPGWMDRERREIEWGRRPANQGGGLFPPDVWPVEAEERPGQLRLDRVGPGQPDLALESAESPPPALPDALGLYQPDASGQVFVDPQEIVRDRPEARMESLMRRWLNEECEFQTTLLVFDRDQALPSGLDPQDWRRDWTRQPAGNSREGLLVFYFYGQPERTLAIFGPLARARYGPAALRSTVDAAVQEAGEVEGASEQLERFCYKMSVRLHWLERARASGAGPYREDATARAGQGGWGWIAGLLAAVATAGIAAGLRRKSRRTRQPDTPEPTVILLPETQISPRLGAPWSGGSCAVLSFPPAATGKVRATPTTPTEPGT